MEDRLNSKFKGALLGTAIGDALGQPFEGYSLDQMETALKGGPLDIIQGRYTDDTEMTIGIAESLIQNKGFNGEHMSQCFIENFDPMRGYGPGPVFVLRWIGEGTPWDEAASKLFDGQGSYGNGAAMRVAPVGLFCFDDAEKLRKAAYNSALITHSHVLGLEGAAVQAYAVALAVRADPGVELGVDAFLDELMEFTSVDVYKDKLHAIRGLLHESDVRREMVVQTLGNGIEALNAVPTAIYSFLRNHSSFEDAVTYAVSLGGDTDTIGAMTGAIAGAYTGVEGIPLEWLDRLENGVKGHDYIIELAERLVHVRQTQMNPR